MKRGKSPWHFTAEPLVTHEKQRLQGDTTQKDGLKDVRKDLWIAGWFLGQNFIIVRHHYSSKRLN